MSGIWIVGATGRTGRALAARLAGDHEVVLVGRDATRLQALADPLGARVRAIGSIDRVPAAVRGGDAAVVVNLVGPYPTTGPRLASACPPGTHYVDLANELDGVRGLLATHDEAVATRRTVVTGAGFGVLATESVARRLCTGRPAPAAIRVDGLPSVRSEPGPVGEALAATVVEGMAAGGRRYDGGRLVPAPPASDVEDLVLPDGTTARTAGMPSGELEAAYRASGAPRVVAASALAPSGPAARVLLPAVATVLGVPLVRRAAIPALARLRLPDRPPARDVSWARARVREVDGTVRTAWLRAGDAMDFTIAAAAEVTERLARGEGEPGACTPAAAFGPELATAAGARFVLDDETV
ncbi:NAD(P)H-binding protein [Actinomycetospora endophytica]|uniref:NAD(P)H-binding protein n=1 Tax=Actinomycetospora endophytica TaxID=2291215 RepID=A0ABS8P727_9PSEU|nr:NAD(P)H-binding protein [Actinomycetospora endophytica]MCD2193732.1 NAD(P)H-binding protein [Actinomycetospora endophytica]